MQSSIGPPQSMEHIYLEYHYTKLSTYSKMHIYTESRWTPHLKQSIKADHLLADKCLY